MGTIDFDASGNAGCFNKAIDFNAAFVRMKERHLELKEKYPDKPQAKGPALTGISNARPETKELEIFYKGY